MVGRIAGWGWPGAENRQRVASVRANEGPGLRAVRMNTHAQPRPLCLAHPPASEPIALADLLLSAGRSPGLDESDKRDAIDE